MILTVVFDEYAHIPAIVFPRVYCMEGLRRRRQSWPPKYAKLYANLGGGDPCVDIKGRKEGRQSLSNHYFYLFLVLF